MILFATHRDCVRARNEHVNKKHEDGGATDDGSSRSSEERCGREAQTHWPVSGRLTATQRSSKRFLGSPSHHPTKGQRANDRRRNRRRNPDHRVSNRRGMYRDGTYLTSPGTALARSLQSNAALLDGSPTSTRSCRQRTSPKLGVQMLRLPSNPPGRHSRRFAGAAWAKCGARWRPG